MQRFALLRAGLATNGTLVGFTVVDAPCLFGEPLAHVANPASIAGE